MSKTAVFTVCAQNYLHFAKTLMQSIRSQQPSWEKYVLLADKADGIDLTSFDFRVKTVTDLPHPEVRKFLFRYNVLELCTAVKPWMFEWLFQEGFERVIYLDPDIFVYSPLAEVETSFEEGSFMILTPHLTGFLDERKPSEHDILIAGAYNLGFLGLASHSQLPVFLEWWRKKLDMNCVIDINRGYFVDQKWFDLAPGMFDKVKIIRDPGYNVAYWNLSHRCLTESGSQVLVNGSPLVFYHFSGLNPFDSKKLSKHQERYRLNDFPVLSGLTATYIQKLKLAGLENYQNVEYGFARFDDGLPIADILRQCYRENPLLAGQAGPNPFCSSTIFLDGQAVQGKPSLPLINKLMLHIWKTRADLQNIFSDLAGRDRVAFCEWFINANQFEYHLPIEYSATILESLRKCQNGQNKTRNLTKRVRASVRNRSSRLFYRLDNKLYFIKKYIPTETKEKFKSWFSRRMRSEAKRNHLLPKEGPRGVNIIGYCRAEMGMGEVSRISAKALNTTGVPFGMTDFNGMNTARKQDDSWANKEAEKPFYQTNLFAVNADQLSIAQIYKRGTEIFSGRYNIGYWAWELPEFPDEWTNAFRLLNEVWVISDFILKSVSSKATIPVLTMPLAIQVSFPDHLTRDHFHLPRNRFLFLTMYDTHSFQARKNPEGSILAFQKAFTPQSNSVGLVVKINNPQSQPDEIQQLKKLIDGWQNIYLIDSIISRTEMDALLGLTDSFISLHRSEGFGLGLAESMYLGKPVIGTNWSGNTDFMHADNSCPVNYQMVKLGQDYGPYKAHQVWAEPDMDHAVYYMRKLVDDPVWRRELGDRGAETIHRKFSPKAVGGMMQARLKRLGLV